MVSNISRSIPTGGSTQDDRPLPRMWIEESAPFSTATQRSGLSPCPSLLPCVAATAASVSTSAFSASAKYGVTPLRAAPARKTKCAGRKPRLSDRQSSEDQPLTQGATRIPALRRARSSNSAAPASRSLIPARVPVPRRNAIGFEYGIDLQPLSPDCAGWELLLPELRAAATRLFRRELCRTPDRVNAGARPCATRTRLIGIRPCGRPFPWRSRPESSVRCFRR